MGHKNLFKTKAERNAYIVKEKRKGTVNAKIASVTDLTGRFRMLIVPISGPDGLQDKRAQEGKERSPNGTRLASGTLCEETLTEASGLWLQTCFMKWVKGVLLDIWRELIGPERRPKGSKG